MRHEDPMRQIVSTTWGIGLFAALLAAPGCGGGGDDVERPHQVVPVSGVVTYKGQPVDGASVTFHPADGGGSPTAPGKPAARAKTDSQGRFRLWTYDHDDGAVPGEHVVTVSKVEIAAPDIDPDAPDFDAEQAPAELPPQYLVPEKYGSKATSDLRATVTPEGPNDDFTFELKD